MKEKLISVIVPIYNKEKYLSKCIESLISQSYSNIEIILIDDGSFDNSSSICQEYVSKYENIKYIKTDNNGVSSARNIGIELAHGYKIVFVDADDYVDKEYISSLVEENYDMVVEGYFKDEDGKICSYDFMSGSYSKDTIFELILQKEITNIFSVPYLKIFNLDLIKKNELKFDKNLSFGEDFDFVISYLSVIKQNIMLKNEKHYFNRIENGSLSRKAIPNIWEQLTIILNKLEKLYNNDEKAMSYYFMRFSKITLLNIEFNKYMKFRKEMKKIIQSKYFKYLKISNFKIGSIDRFIIYIYKFRLFLLAYVIFYIKRKNKY